MIYNKIYKGVDLDGTPLPILIVFFIFMGFLFLFIGLIAQLIINKDTKKDSIEENIAEKLEN